MWPDRTLLAGLRAGLLALLVVAAAPVAGWAEYDPLAVAAVAGKPAKPIELVVRDARRDREIPLHAYLPEKVGRVPCVLFSHGLGGSRNGGRYLGEHWSARGYVVVCLQHPGSDSSVWQDKPMAQRMAAMKSAASIKNLRLRCEDVVAVLDQLQAWSDQSEHPLHQRIDLGRVGMSGHSFGAQTTQSVSGQSNPLIGTNWVDPRIDAAIAFSPSVPVRASKRDAFAKVRIPWLLMTGTNDTAAIGNQTPESRREVYPNLPESIDKYELVLHEGTHFLFSDGEGTRIPWRQRNPAQRRAILALSTAFWDAYLKDDAAAKAWLTGDAVQAVLNPKDQWQHHAKKE